MARAHSAQNRYFAIILLPVFALYALLFAYPFANRFFASRSGKAEAFFPRVYDEHFYSFGSALPERIGKAGFEEQCLSKLSPLDRSVFANYYMDEGDSWKMNGAYSERSFEDTITLVREIEKEGLVPPEAVAGFIDSLKKASIERNMNELNARVDAFLETWPMSFSSSLAIRNGANGLFAVGEVKTILSASWSVRRFELGIGGFAAVFALFSFAGILLVARSLVQPMRSWNAVGEGARVAFFIPAALSLTLVAVAWNPLHNGLFSRLPGMDTMPGVPSLTPALVAIVLVIFAVARLRLYSLDKKGIAPGAVKG